MAPSHRRLAKVRRHWVKGSRWLSQNYPPNIPIGEGHVKEGAAEHETP